jgi:predicted enzyme related to lactoylglutathione lyase
VPLRDSAPIGAPCWVDLFTSDPDRSTEFYGRLFGWTAEAPNEEFGGYINLNKDGIRIAGAMKNDGSTGTPDVWSVYLATEDAQATADAAVANGGQVFVPPMQVGDFGTMVLLADAGGAAIGAWQPDEHHGFGILGDPGTPSWFELHTRDYDATTKFYRDVFKWNAHVMADEPGFRYTTLGEGDDSLAGIMDATAFLPDGVSAHWSIYFGVKDADAALAEIVELGGSVVAPAEDTPYGRLATVADPTGALFKLRG